MALTPAVQKRVEALGLLEQQTYAAIEPALLLPIAEVRANPDNPKICQDARLLAIATSLKTKGWVPSELPLVWRAGGPTPYMLINGEHRWLIARAAGFERFPAVVAKGIDCAEDAIALTMALEEARARRDKGKWARNLMDLAAAGRDDELRDILRVRDPALLRELANQQRGRIEAAVQERQEQRASAPRLVSFTLTGAQYDSLQQAMHQAKTRIKQAQELVGMVQELVDKDVVALAAVIRNGQADEAGRNDQGHSPRQRKRRDAV
jgi:ParB-like chromosome segregation protein Spo0J